jgi:hypothetical protein
MKMKCFKIRIHLFVHKWAVPTRGVRTKPGPGDPEGGPVTDSVVYVFGLSR